MSIEYWTALYGSIPIKHRPCAIPLPKPTDDTIARFEQQAHFQLPTGYKDYIKVFGPGELAWEYKIKAPGYPERRRAVDLYSFNYSVHLQFTDDFLGRRSDGDQVNRLLYFCDTGGGELIGWDPLDVQNDKNYEYGIYVLSHEPTLTKIADSFQDFIEDVCLSEENLYIPGWDDEELGPRRFFDPACDYSG